MIYRLNTIAQCKLCGQVYSEEFLAADDRLDDEEPDMDSIAALVDECLLLCPECRKSNHLREFCDYLMATTTLEA